MRKKFNSLYGFKSLSISLKLLLSTALLILLSIFMVSTLSYISYTRDFKMQSANRVQQTIEQVSLNISTYLDDLYRLSISPYFNQDVIDALEQNKELSTLEDLENTRLIEGFLDQIMIIPRKDVTRVFIFSDRIYLSERKRAPINYNEDFRSYDWYKQALNSPSTIIVPTRLEDFVNNPTNMIFSLVKQIRSTTDVSKILGVIKVDANYSVIKSICNKADMGRDGGILIIDEKRNIIFSNFTKLTYNDLSKKLVGDSIETISVNNEEFLVNSTDIQNSGWKILAVTSVSELNSKALMIRNTSFLMAVICSALAIIVLIIFIKWFLKPLMEIILLMHEVKKGNLNVKFPNFKEDEIGYLGTSFNDMLHRIRDSVEKNENLIKEVYEVKYLHKEAIINSLYNQIRPHFIYNTLNMISLMVQSGNTDKAVDSINRLCRILRGMSKQDKEVFLKSEIELISAYLGLQSSRYDGRLEYTIDIDPSLNNYIIPSLLLQPIVENAVIHGCEEKRDKSHIHIYSKYWDDKLLLVIEDTGVGMSPEKVHLINEKINQEHSSINKEIDAEDYKTNSGIALININRRIKLKYGSQFGIEIESKMGVGTRVNIILPNFNKGGHEVV